MTSTDTERFDRQVRFFGVAGQHRLSSTRVAVVGLGGLGSHVVQQLALLGVSAIVGIDSEELAKTDRNRLVGARHDDPIPEMPKVEIAERLARSIDPFVRFEKVHDSFISDAGMRAIIGSEYLIGSVDSEGARLVLTELAAAYEKPYLDFASDIVPGNPTEYGGQICIAWNGGGCLSCLSVLDRREAEIDLAGPSERHRRDELYGVRRELLDEVGPSVASINGVIASIGVTEFMLGVTGVRPPNRLVTYNGRTGKATVSTDAPAADCYYCKGIRGLGDRADVQRYVREGVGSYLR